MILLYNKIWTSRARLGNVKLFSITWLAHVAVFRQSWLVRQTSGTCMIVVVWQSLCDQILSYIAREDFSVLFQLLFIGWFWWMGWRRCYFSQWLFFLFTSFIQQWQKPFAYEWKTFVFCAWLGICHQCWRTFDIHWLQG